MNLRSSAAVAALSLSFGLIVPPPPSPVSAAHPGEPPTVTADAWILYDATSDVVLDGVAIDDPRAMASVTKMMTALVARDHLDLDTLVRISDTAAGAGESEVGLVAGERWAVRDLPTRTERAAPTSGRTIGRGTNQVTEPPPAR